jgi:hypothetical protein
LGGGGGSLLSGSRGSHPSVRSLSTPCQRPGALGMQIPVPTLLLAPLS